MYENNFEQNDMGLPTSIGTASDAQNLMKALSAGDVVNPAAMGTGGNTLQFESLEPQLVSALAETTADFKLMQLQPRFKVGSTVHQYTQETNSGSYEEIFSAEAEAPTESTSVFARITRNIKYMQTKRDITLQMLKLNPTIGGSPEAVEERLGSLTLLKGAEWACFHGNEAISDDIPSGYPAQIRSDASQNVFDMLGKKISDTGGEGIITEAVRSVYEQGGEISDMYFPPILAQGWMDLLKDRMRYDASSRIAGQKLTTFQTSYGNDIMISGRSGVDKMYSVKGIPTPSTSASAPTAPTFASTPGASTTGTGFVTATAGDYEYVVYAVDIKGRISAASAQATVTLAAGQENSIVITRGAADNTGFIVCRGKKDATSADVREMYRVASAGATTTTLDNNDELPGTGEILMLSANMAEKTFQFDSFMDLMRFDLGKVRASQPFLLAWYGTPDLKIANFNGLIKNIAHSGVDGWF